MRTLIRLQLLERKTGNSAVLRKILFDIVDEYGVLPDCLKVTGITWDPVTGANRVNINGGFADIYKGRLGKETVALKVLKNTNSDSRVSSLNMLNTQLTNAPYHDNRCCSKKPLFGTSCPMRGFFRSTAYAIPYSLQNWNARC